MRPSSASRQCRGIMPRRRFRIGLLLDDPDVPKWVYDFALWAKDHPAIDLAAAIVHSGTRRSLFDILLSVENKLLLRANDYRAYADARTICDIVPVKLFARARPTKRRGEFELDSGDVARIGEWKLDALVRCGRAMPSGSILEAARHGMISVCAGGAGNGATDGFAEVLEGRPETAFTVERLRPEGEPREILFSGSVATALLFAWNVVSLQARAFQYLQMTLERLATGTVQKVRASRPEGGTPRNIDILAYGFRSARRCLRKALRRYSGQEFNWQVGFASEPWPDAEFARGSVIPNPAGAFLADPFAIKVEGANFIFVEEFSFETRKGVITAYRIENGEPRRIGVVLEESYHLSFPFVFEHGGEIYMVPESGADGSVRLYRSTSFPAGWTEAKVLMTGVSAVDTVLFERDSLWWMLTTIQGKGPGLNNCELHAFYAPDPLGDWLPHKKNPIVMNARKGRNGGLLHDQNGSPCRVAQVSAFTFYGAFSAIYRIDEISPETYRETLVKEIHPNFFPKLDGTHHLSCADDVTFFDFMRIERPMKSERRNAVPEGRPAQPRAKMHVPAR